VEALCGRPVLETNRIVEDWMLETNERIAGFLAEKSAPILYRNHAKPGPADLTEFHGLCRSFGVRPRGKDLNERYKTAFAELSLRPHAAVFNRMLLRTMPRARYEDQNRGHFGIGARVYTHFTSPIRRYSDLAVHRALKRVLRAGTVQMPRASKRGNRPPYGRPADLRTLGRHCTEQEELAMRTEREAYKWMACRYVRGRESERFRAVVSGVQNFGVFVELVDMPVEGLILRRSLPHDSYRYDQESLALVGQLSKTRFAMGQELDVILKRVDLERRRIDFVLAP
jgi:ribonuclease R